MRCVDCDYYRREPGLYSDDPHINVCDKTNNYFPVSDRWYSDPDTPEWCPLKLEEKK